MSPGKQLGLASVADVLEYLTCWHDFCCLNVLPHSCHFFHLITPQSHANNVRHGLSSLTRFQLYSRFSPNPAVLACYNSSEPTPWEREMGGGGSPTLCFHRLQHLDPRTSFLLRPVWGQGHIGGSKRSRHISLAKDNILCKKRLSE